MQHWETALCSFMHCISIMPGKHEKWQADKYEWKELIVTQISLLTILLDSALCFLSLTSLKYLCTPAYLQYANCITIIECNYLKLLVKKN